MIRKSGTGFPKIMLKQKDRADDDSKKSHPLRNQRRVLARARKNIADRFQTLSEFDGDRCSSTAAKRIVRRYSAWSRSIARARISSADLPPGEFGHRSPRSAHLVVVAHDDERLPTTSAMSNISLPSALVLR